MLYGVLQQGSARAAPCMNFYSNVINDKTVYTIYVQKPKKYRSIHHKTKTAFSRLEMNLKGMCFADINEVESDFAAALNRTMDDEFQTLFQQ